MVGEIRIRCVYPNKVRNLVDKRVCVQKLTKRRLSVSLTWIDLITAGDVQKTLFIHDINQEINGTDTPLTIRMPCNIVRQNPTSGISSEKCYLASE
jgi:hypothetical protein